MPDTRTEPGFDPVAEVAAAFAVDARIAPDDLGVRRVHIDEAGLRALADNNPRLNPRDAHQIVDAILAATLIGSVKHD